MAGEATDARVQRSKLREATASSAISGTANVVEDQISPLAIKMGDTNEKAPLWVLFHLAKKDLTERRGPARETSEGAPPVAGGATETRVQRSKLREAAASRAISGTANVVEDQISLCQQFGCAKIGLYTLVIDLR